ncbi:MAG: ABC-F family ATP-binding cassette domain-containing protein [Bacilli bacterium]
MDIINLSHSFATHKLFNDINLHINDDEKIGIVGLNGAGKTTLFNIIMGKIQPDVGKVIFKSNFRKELLPQIIDDEIPSLNISVFDFLLQGRPIEYLENQLSLLYEKISKETNETKLTDLYKKLDKTLSLLDYWEVFNAENILLKIIDGMNISNDLIEQKISTLSGGQKSKIAFAKLLYSKPEVILLDEPTNHLDKSTKDYVINYLKNYKGSVYIISHDIDFLNEVTTKTLYIDKSLKSAEVYNGNYLFFKKLHEERQKNLIRQSEIEKHEEDKLRVIVEKYYGSSGNRKKMAQDREKKLNKLISNKTIVSTNQKVANINMTINNEGDFIPLKVENLMFKYDKNSEKNIIDNLSFELSRGEKFLVVGENGVGKSSLLKLIIGQLKQDSGKINIGNKTLIGYYAQEHELLNNDETILDNFKDINISNSGLRSALGSFLFTGDEVFKKVSVLSPGEKCRVALAKLSLKGANFLILDEPTNHLDPVTQKVIAKTFNTFKGTMLVVSHNIEFIDNLGIERTLYLPSGRISFYDKELVKHYETINI